MIKAERMEDNIDAPFPFPMIKQERIEAEEPVIKSQVEPQEDLILDSQCLSTTYTGKSKAVAMSHNLRQAVNEMLKFADASHAYPLWYSWLLNNYSKTVDANINNPLSI